MTKPHLPESYKQRLLEQFDPEAREAYVKGRFVNMKGKVVVHSFNRHKHGDFNGVLRSIGVGERICRLQPRQWLRDQGARTIKVQCLFGVGEMKLRDSSTEALCRAIHIWRMKPQQPVFGEARPMADVAIFSGSIGAARSTKGCPITRSTGFGFRTCGSKINPSVRGASTH